MVYDIDIHELNIRPFRYLKFLDEISFKKCVFFVFLNNKCIIMIKKLPYQIRGDFINGHCFFKFLLFGNVLLTINMKPYGCWKTINYILYVQLILSNLFHLTVGSNIIFASK